MLRKRKLDQDRRRDRRGRGCAAEKAEEVNSGNFSDGWA